MDRRHIGFGLMTVAALLVGSTMPVGAQSGEDVTGSLCKVFSKKQVREAFGRQAGSSDQEPGKCYWGITDQGAYGAQLQLEMAWEPVAFDDVRLLRPGWTDLTVAGRPALFKVKPGQVIGRKGVELRDIDSELVLDLEQGPLRLHVMDGKGKDRQATLEQLGALAVAKDGTLVAPPARDETLAAQLPETINGWPALVRTFPYPGAELCSQCPSGKALRAALKEQGKTVGDVTMLSATDVDPENVIENDFSEPVIQALRVAGGDAAPLVEPVISYLFEGASAEPARTEGDGIVAVSRPMDQYNFGWTAYVYPEGDTVWVVTSYGDVPTDILAALPGARTAPAIPAPTPTPAPDTSTPEGWAQSVVPPVIRGEPVRVAVSPLYDDGSKTTKALKRELKSQDKSLDDVSAIFATTPSGYGIQGFRVVDGDASALLDFLLATGRQTGTLGDEEPVESVIAGKTVRRFQSPLGQVNLYPGGEVLWLVMGSDTLAGEWLSELP